MTKDAEESSRTSGGASLKVQQVAVLQAIYDHFHEHGVWPRFITIDRPIRRTHRWDTGAIVLSMPDLIVWPRSGSLRPLTGDELRLSLLGIQACKGSSEDIVQFLRTLRWLAEREEGYEPPPGSSDEMPQVTSAEIAAHLGNDTGDQIALQRIYAMLQLDHWGLGGSGSDKDGWYVRLGQDIWRFRDVHSVEDCIAAREAWLAEGRPVVPEATETYVDGETPEATAADTQSMYEASDSDQSWSESLSHQTGRALDSTVGHWLPPESLALYARWWQLETWLRQLAYVELRARDGKQWENAVRMASGRQAQDAQFSHMTSTDTENPLAYLDYSQLQEIIEKSWFQFAPALIRQSSWIARQEELARIRHRIGHMRRPHTDDLNRVEQTLRDLEQGAFVACASYNKRTIPSVENHNDAVTVGWLRLQHAKAKLIEHAKNQYDTEVVLDASRRPWAKWPENLANASGVLWHVGFYMRNRSVDVADFWNARNLAEARSLVLHLIADNPSSISLTFPAVDDDHAVADAIGAALETLLSVSRPGRLEDSEELRWRRRALGADYRVVYGTGWSIVDETTIPVSAFGAGGGVISAVSWLRVRKRSPRPSPTGMDSVRHSARRRAHSHHPEPRGYRPVTPLLLIR